MRQRKPNFFTIRLLLVSFSKMKETVQWYCYAISRVIAFRGRAGRQEAWCFFVIQCIVLALLCAIDYFWAGFPILCPLYAAFSLVPTILLFIRRLHDCGYSGWWVILAGWPPICFFLMAWAPDPMEPNEYGTTERLPRKENNSTEIPPIVDGVEYLTQPDLKQRQQSERGEKAEVMQEVKSEESVHADQTKSS